MQSRKRTGSIRTLTLSVCGVVGAAILVALVILLGRSPARSASTSTQEPGTIPPDIKDAPTQQSGRGVTQLGAGKGMYVQVADRNDPGRVAGELLSETSEPLEARRYLLTRPRAWAFLRDGRTMYAEADTGRAFIPDTGPGSRPEEGSLKGNVLVKLFPPMDRRPDPATDTPDLTVSTNSLAFNGTLGELRFDEPVDFKGERFHFKGRGIIALFNEGRQQLELLRIEEPLSPLTILPQSRATTAPPSAPATTPANGVRSAGASEAQPARTPTITAYRLNAIDDIHIVNAGRELRSDRMDAWIRLYDNALKPEALGSRVPARPRFVPELRSIPGAIASLMLASPQPEPTTLSSFREPIQISWAGPLEIRPAPLEAHELAANDVFVRFTATAIGGTRLSDASSKAHGVARSLEYGATRREATLVEQTPALARFDLGDRGHALAPRFDVNLGSGEVRVPEGGRLISAIADASPDAPERFVSWTRDASFLFDTHNGEMTSRLREARMSGDVLATDSKGVLTGDSLSAAFVSDDQDNPQLSFLKVIGSALAKDGREGQLAADTVGVTFAPGDGDPRPTHLDASGNVHASRPDTTIDADTLKAVLTTNDKGDVTPESILATGSVRYAGPDAITASTERLEADAIARTAILTGENSRVSRDRTSVIGGLIRLHDASKSLEVEGPGRFAHAGTSSLGEEVANASWTRSMHYDDLEGAVRCEGDVNAILTRGSLERHTMGGERVAIDLTPPSKPLAESPTNPDAITTPAIDTTTSRDVRLVTIESGTTPAWLELRQFDPAAPAGDSLRVERELRLTGQTITGDAPAGLIRVDGEGTCRLIDLRADTPTNDSAARNPFAGSLRGAARFTWRDGMLYERAKGILTMKDKVTLTHVRHAENFRTELDCDLLVARIREDSGAASTPGEFRGELVGATATGNVWMRSNAKEITAGVLDYDAIARTVDAKSLPGGTIVYLDPATGSPVEAERALWNLAKDRVELRGVRTIVAPR